MHSPLKPKIYDFENQTKKFSFRSFCQLLQQQDDPVERLCENVKKLSKSHKGWEGRDRAGALNYSKGSYPLLIEKFGFSWLHLRLTKKRPTTSSLGLSNKNNKMMIICTVFFYYSRKKQCYFECDKNDLVRSAAAKYIHASWEFSGLSNLIVLGTRTLFRNTKKLNFQ